MCGIVGVSGDVSREQFERATDCQRGRGPDAEGLWMIYRPSSGFGAPIRR